MGVAVHKASIADRDGARLLLLGKVGNRLPRMEKVWADRGYNGKIGEWIKERLGWTLEIAKPREKGAANRSCQNRTSSPGTASPKGCRSLAQTGYW